MTVTRSEPTTHGIPTTYRGTRFRSRLESRWAAFFDLVSWSWVYEPFDGEGWIPDFLIQGELPLLIEVGPVSTPAEFYLKATKPLAHLEHPTLVLGISPIVLGDDERAGVITNEFPSVVGPAFWMICAGCPPSSEHTLGALRVYGDSVDRPCGHGMGRPARSRWLFDLWAEAGNRVQWQARRAWKP